MKLKNQTKKDHTMKKSDKKAENRKTAGVEKKIVKVTVCPGRSDLIHTSQISDLFPLRTSKESSLSS